MKKMNKKFVSVMATAALAAGVVAPVAPVATSSVSAATASINALSTPTVKDDDEDVRLGHVRVNIPAGGLKAGDVLTIKLPSDTEFVQENGEYLFDTDTDGTTTDTNRVYVPEFYSGDDKNALYAAGLEVERLSKDEIKITVENEPNLNEDSVFYLQLNRIKINNAKDGELVARFSAPSGSGFPTGTVTIGNVSSSGSVSLATSGLDSSSDNFDFNLRIQEDIANGLERNSNSLRLKLPNGFKWTGLRDGQTIEVKKGGGTVTDDNGKRATTIYGDNITFTVVVKDNGQTIEFDTSEGGAHRDTNPQPSLWELPLSFTVDDESRAKAGDVMVNVSGRTDTNVSQIKVGTYGEYETTVSVESVVELIAGKDEQELDDIIIKEAVGHSLIHGRTITFTLPEGARWQAEYEVDDRDKAGSSFVGNVKKSEGVDLIPRGYQGTDNRTLRFEVHNPNPGDPAEIKLEDVEIAIAPYFTGDLEIEVGGTAGVSGTITVANVKAPITAEVDELPNVIIGRSGQEAGTIIISETVAEALTNDRDANKVELDLPDGVSFDRVPTVKVTDGDLRITNVKLRADGRENDNILEFTIDSESTEPSTIEISDVSLRIDRTVPEGDITLEVKGSAVAETRQYSDWENDDAVAKVAIAKVATPAPSDTTAEVEFVIGSSTYTVNGVEKTMDVAPFIENGRTYLPIRFVAEAVGVSENNIIWNDAARTVTIIKGDRVVQLTIGSNILTVNGVGVPMDVSAFIRDDRTYLPISFVAQALGLDVEWDDASRTVKIN